VIDNNVVRDVIVIGASAGGIEAITRVLSLLPGDLRATIGIVIHRGPDPGDWSGVLARRTRLVVRQPYDGERLEPGIAYLAPGGTHMMFEQTTVRLDHGEPRHYTKPAIDPLFESAATSFGSRVVGVALTGAGHDGATGLAAIIDAGGLALVQTPAQADHPQLPESAIARNQSACILELDDIADALRRLVAGESYRVARRSASTPS
jgi:two-component system chemotaxis response regulator CheB